MTRLTPQKIDMINHDILREDNQKQAQLNEQTIGQQFFTDFFRSPATHLAQETSLLAFVTQKSLEELLRLCASCCHVDELSTAQIPLLSDWDTKSEPEKKSCALTLIQTNSPLCAFYNPVDEVENNIPAIKKIQFGFTQAWLNQCIPSSGAYVRELESIIRFHTQYTSGIGFALIAGEWIPHLKLFLSAQNPTFSLGFHTDRQIKIFIENDCLFYQSAGRLTLYGETIQPIDLGLITATFKPTTEGMVLQEVLYENTLFGNMLNHETPDTTHHETYQLLHHVITNHLESSRNLSLEHQLQLLFLLYDYATIHNVTNALLDLTIQLQQIFANQSDFQEIANIMNLTVPHADIIYAALKRHIESLHRQDPSLSADERTAHITTLIARAMQHNLPIDLSRLNLCGIDFSGATLKNARLTDCVIDNETKISDCDFLNIECDTLQVRFPFYDIQITLSANQHGIKTLPWTLLYYAQKKPQSGPAEIVRQAQLLALKNYFEQNESLSRQLLTEFQDVLKSTKTFDTLTSALMQAIKYPFGRTSDALFTALAKAHTPQIPLASHPSTLFYEPSQPLPTSIPTEHNPPTITT